MLPKKYLKVKFTPAETKAARRMRGHLRTGLIAFGIAYGLSALILAGGTSLSELLDIGPDSLLFRLWPPNETYLHQFARSHYASSEVKRFFTVVSLSNLVWLVFLAWKFVFELLRRDVAFPRGNTPGLRQLIVRPLVICCFQVVAFVALNLLGFADERYALLGLALRQSIGVGAFKVVMVWMAFLYFAAAFAIEFGGLGIRYLLSKKVGWFLADKNQGMLSRSNKNQQSKSARSRLRAAR